MQAAQRAPSAVFSACALHRGDGCSESCVGRRYRYVLRWPTGLNNDRVALGIFANPSTADCAKLDPTLTRWRNHCREWGYGWSITCNVMAWRATNPKDVPTDGTEFGPDNLLHITEQAGLAELIVCGWGNIDHGGGTQVLRLLRAMNVVPYALKLTKSLRPAHPLYLRADLKPFPIV